MNRTLLLCFCMLLAVGVAWADPVPPARPIAVPSKEYSNHMDEDSVGVLDAHQNIWWDGLGGAADTFDYTLAIGLWGLQETQVDALAHIKDQYYYHVSHRDGVTLLASFTGIGDIHYTAPIHHGLAHATAPNIGIWAAGPIDINIGSPPDDVDGLEVWGPSGIGGDDANKFSLIGDPGAAGLARVSVWNYIGGAASPYIFAVDIAAAIGRTDLAGVIDVDAMMVFDQVGDDTFTFEGGAGTPPDSIMFSIAPVDIFDGGEIWVWDYAGAGSAAAFLVHGGETWDTAHVVGDHFGLGAADSENINALEAVPEPGTMSLLALGGLALVWWRKRR